MVASGLNARSVPPPRRCVRVRLVLLPAEPFLTFTHGRNSHVPELSRGTDMPSTRHRFAKCGLTPLPGIAFAINQSKERTVERRNLIQRAELVRWVVAEIVQNPGVQVTTSKVAEWLHVPGDVAERIVNRLVGAGLLREVRRGVWMRTYD